MDSIRAKVVGQDCWMENRSNAATAKNGKIQINFKPMKPTKKKSVRMKKRLGWAVVRMRDGYCLNDFQNLIFATRKGAEYAQSWLTMNSRICRVKIEEVK